LSPHFSRFNLQVLDNIAQMVGIARAPVAVPVLGTVESLVAQALRAILTNNQHLRINNQHLRTKHHHQFIQPHQKANQELQGFVQY
jgi:hypothetical protein